jgi:DNA polymerase III alpha subunit
MFYEKICAEPKLKQKKNRKELEQLFWSMTSGSTLCDPIVDYGLEDKIGFENELMKFSLRGSPFEILDRDKKIEAIRASLSDVTTLDEFTESEDEIARIPVVLKDWKERPQRNGQMFAFMKFAVQSGEEFEAPAFSSVWKYVSKLAKKSSVYIATFNRKMDDPAALILGRPGWAQSEKSATQAMINVDSVEL